MAAREELELLLSQHRIWVKLEESEGWKEYKASVEMLIRTNRQIMEKTHVVSLDSAFQVASMRGVVEGLRDSIVLVRNTIEDLDIALINARDELEFEEEEHGK